MSVLRQELETLFNTLHPKPLPGETFSKMIQSQDGDSVNEALRRAWTEFMEAMSDWQTRMRIHRSRVGGILSDAQTELEYAAKGRSFENWSNLLSVVQSAKDLDHARDRALRAWVMYRFF